MVLATGKFDALQTASANRLSNRNTFGRLVESWEAFKGVGTKKTQLLVDANGKALRESTSKNVSGAWLEYGEVNNHWSLVTGSIVNQEVSQAGAVL